jgi:tRNA isopentenyl-2-thiomethyl-A-37 hydroxylase MiaE
MKRFIIGISQTTDIDILLKSGFRQFYFGFIDEVYLQKYSTQISPNRRYRLKEQFYDIKEAKKCIKKIKEQEGIVYLALNSFFNNQTMLEHFKKIFDTFKTDIDGVIVANLSTLLYLKDIGYNDIVLSNLFGIYTDEAVKFFKRFNPKKMILPRDISIKDIQKIVSSNPDIDFECFLYGDNCRFSEAFCFSEHGYDSLGFGSLCSFAFSNKLPKQAPNHNFKQLIKNPKITPDQKLQLLKSKNLNLQNLLDELEVAIFENKKESINKIVNFLQRVDMEYFKISKSNYIRAIRVLQNLNQEKANILAQKLIDNGYKEEDSYKQFHKLNSYAIKKTIEIFQAYKNIVSYKIPSRGRELYEYITNPPKENYNYKQSQYQL